MVYFSDVSRKGSCLCPACGKDLAPKSIHSHTLECPKWKEVYGQPYPYFKFSANPVWYQPEMVDGVDYVRCLKCFEYGWDFRFRRLIQHLLVHGLDEVVYLTEYPEAKIRLANTNAAREATVKSKYGVANVFQLESVKEASKATMLEKYGGTSPIKTSRFSTKIATTNRERYGTDNPFASKEVQEKIRQAHFQKRGVFSPAHDPEVRAKIEDTNLKKYGSKYFFTTVKFRDKFIETSRDIFGEDHPMKSEAGKLLHQQGCLDKLGVKNPFLRKDILEKSHQTHRDNHGGKFYFSDLKFIEARKQTLLTQYGVDNISKVPEIKEKIIAILRERWCNAVPKINNLELAVEALAPARVVFSGDWTYWITWASGKRKNPDFVVLTEDQLLAHAAGVSLNDLRTNLVIEVNGDFWHTTHKGITREDREREFLDGYASVGVSCLIIWGSDLEKDPELVSDRVQNFIKP